MKLKLKYLLPLLIFISSCFDTCQNNSETVLEQWENGNPKKVRVQYPPPEELETNYYENGTIESEGIIVDEKKKGMWYFYHKNGNKKRLAYFKEDIPVAESITYYEDETLKQIKAYDSNGIASGTWETYYQNGEIKSSGDYEGDEKRGSWEYYNNSGSLESTEYFNQYGNLEDIKYYDSGKLIRWEKGYPNGFQHIVQVKEDDLTSHIVYYENGKIQEEGKYSGSIEVGWWTFRYTNGNKKAEGAFVEDLQDKKYKNITKEEKWLNKLPVDKKFRGIKTGKWNYWNIKGQKIFIIEYSIKNGKLVEKVKYRRH